MAVTSLAEALALLTPETPGTITAADMRQVVTWLAQNGGNEATIVWASQPEWFISWSRGSDSWPGDSAEAPIKTVAELYRRTRGLDLCAETNGARWYFLDAVHPEDPCPFIFAPASPYAPAIYGLATEVASGTTSSVQPWVRGSAVGAFSASGMPTNWAGLLQKRGRFVTGPCAGATFFPIRATGAARVQFTPTQYNLEQAFTGDYPPGDNPTDGDDFVIETLTRFTGKVELWQGASFLPAFSAVDFGGGAHRVQLSAGGVQFWNCLVSGIDGKGSCDLGSFGSLVTGLRLYGSSEFHSWNDLLFGMTSVFGGKLSVYSTVSYGSIYLGRAYGGAKSQLFLVSDATYDPGSFGLTIIDGSPFDWGVVCENGAFVDACGSTISFVDVSTNGFYMNALCDMVCDESKKPVFLTPCTNEILMGTQAHAIADIPTTGDLVLTGQNGNRVAFRSFDTGT